VGNEGADKLAGEASRKEETDEINMTIRPDLILPGAKLKSMTQSTAYKIIRTQKMIKPKYREALNRRATVRNMALAKGAVSDLSKVAALPSTIWLSTRHKDVPRNIRYFLWMLIHDGYKVGGHWAKIDGFEHQGICPVCETSETMKHILTECDAPGQELIWDLASRLWRKKTGEDLRPTTGEIMACGAIQKSNKGETRLYRILVSESAYLIWCLRNKRVIGMKDGASDQEITNRWRKTLNNRLELDCILTNKTKYGKKAMGKPLVLETWNKILQNEDRLPDDWTREAGVLVGLED